jgi:uncharacterized membrane protein YozB (DUF420 family)
MPDSEVVESALAGISSDLAIMIGLFFFVVSMGVSYWADKNNRKVSVFVIIITITWTAFFLGLYLWPYLVGPHRYP